MRSHAIDDGLMSEAPDVMIPTPVLSPAPLKLCISSAGHRTILDLECFCVHRDILWKPSQGEATLKEPTCAVSAVPRDVAALPRQSIDAARVDTERIAPGVTRKQTTLHTCAFQQAPGIEGWVGVGWSFATMADVISFLVRMTILPCAHVTKVDSFLDKSRRIEWVAHSSTHLHPEYQRPFRALVNHLRVP